MAERTSIRMNESGVRNIIWGEWTTNYENITHDEWKGEKKFSPFLLFHMEYLL